ncbi:MAG: hypothetical protein IPL33_02390 [Sphingobacteriales bacterium]|nr:hypothetical protein [Sphingobacteriales bacterium]
MYVAAAGEWYNIGGQYTPLHIYRDVAYLPDSHKVRFGCDGRGVWEFVISTPPVAVKMSAALEGCYSGGTMNTTLRNNNLLPANQPFNRAPWWYNGTEQSTNLPTNAVDWVLVEVRQPNAPYDIVAQKAALLLANGTIKDPGAATNEIQVTGLTAGDTYRLSLKTRNHLAVLSSQSMTLPNATAYDLRIVANVEDGNIQLKNMGSSTYALKAADMNADGIITVADYNYYATQISLINVYNDADCQLNGSVTVADFNLLQPNSSSIGVSTIRY